MSDAERIEQLELMVASLAAFVSTMPGAAMTEPETAEARMNDMLRAVRGSYARPEEASDRLYKLVGVGPRRHPFRKGAANED